MKCEDCKGHLIEHAHDELDSAAAGAVARHLATCSACALEFCRLRADLDGVARAYDRSPRRAVTEQLRARVQAHVAKPRPPRVLAWLRRPVPAYGALAAAAAPIVMWLGLNLAHSPEGTDAVHSPTPALIEAYDASDLLRLDPNLL